MEEFDLKRMALKNSLLELSDVLSDERFETTNKHETDAVRTLVLYFIEQNIKYLNGYVPEWEKSSS